MMERTQSEIVLDALKLCADHYTHAFGRFSALDNKAQGTITTSGVLLGAVLAFVPQPIFDRVLAFTSIAPVTVRILVAAALLAMLGGVSALAVRPGRSPFRSEAVAEAVLDMTRSMEKAPATVVEAHYLRQLKEWQITLEDISATLKVKARALAFAQFCVIIAASMVGVFVTIAISARP